MIRKTGFKTLLLAASIGLAVTGCSDTGSQRALSKDQVQFLNHLDQAKFYQKQGQLKASFQEAQNALSLNPDSLEVQLLIAENMLLAGDLRNAERYYRNLLEDRKSTRLNSSHIRISYAVFCLKKKKK